MYIFFVRSVSVSLDILCGTVATSIGCSNTTLIFSAGNEIFFGDYRLIRGLSSFSHGKRCEPIAKLVYRREVLRLLAYIMAEKSFLRSSKRCVFGGCIVHLDGVTLVLRPVRIFSQSLQLIAFCNHIMQLNSEILHFAL